MGFWSVIKGEEPGPIRTLLHYRNPGQFGEYATRFALTNHNLRGNLTVLNNIYLPWKGKTSEVDLLMLHEKGLFVFESKNYSGWIFGEEEELYWTQVLGSGRENQFYNPIRQNYTHIRALAAYLHKPVAEFASYIVFSERCTLQQVPDTDKAVVVRRPDLLRVLRNELRRAPVRYSREEIREMAVRLKPLTHPSKAEKLRHIRDIETKCPICGSNLVLRQGSYGQFWGCAAYPKCKFTRKFSHET